MWQRGQYTSDRTPYTLCLHMLPQYHPPRPSGGRLDRWTMALEPGFMGSSEPHLYRDILRHQPNLLHCTDITLLLLQIFRVNDTGLEKRIQEVKYEVVNGNHLN